LGISRILKVMTSRHEMASRFEDYFFEAFLPFFFFFIAMVCFLLRER